MRCQNTFNKQGESELAGTFSGCNSIHPVTQLHLSSTGWGWRVGGDAGKEEGRVGGEGEREGEGPQVKKKERWQRR